MRDLAALFRREAHLCFAQGAGLSVGLIFFLCLVVVFTFGLGPDLKTLARTGPAILWAGPLLSILLGLSHLFQADAEDGVLDVYRMAPQAMETIVFVKAAAYWASTALPLIAAAPLFGLMMSMEGEVILGCLICLFVGSPALVFIGAMASALTLSVKRNGMLLSILATPFLVPVLIFGVSASTAFANPEASFGPPFLYLCACSLFSGVVSAFAGAAAIRAVNIP